MERQEKLKNLEAFARRSIAAARFPNAHHRFTAAACPVCGVVPLSLTIEHHTGSKKGNFRGRISGRCPTCRRQVSILSFTGEHRKRERKEKPVCRCGSVHFLVGECERIERDEGLPGFFDEGVVVGKCGACGRNRAFVHLD